MAKSSFPKTKSLKIGAADIDRLDLFLTRKFSKYSRTFFKRLINSRAISVDGHAASPHHKLQIGQVVTIDWPKKVEFDFSSGVKELPFPILYEDEHLFVLDKPAGLLVHPAGRERNGNTLVEILRSRINRTGWPDDIRPGLVHRLDRDTSGVLIYAKTPEAHSKLSRQFSSRRVKKTYFAVVRGVLPRKKGTLECRMARDPQKRQRFAVTEDGRLAITKFHVVEVMGDQATLVELHPLTGRTHQLRVQLSTYKHPILGDAVYGDHRLKYDFIHRQLLHAAKIQFTHPEKEMDLSFESPLPPDFQSALKLLRS